MCENISHIIIQFLNTHSTLLYLKSTVLIDCQCSKLLNFHILHNYFRLKNYVFCDPGHLYDCPLTFRDLKSEIADPIFTLMKPNE